MTPERFCALLEAYGADLQHWPESERLPAQALAAKGPPELRARLAEAALLDGWLDSHTVAAPDDSLMRRVTAGAPSPRAESQGPRWQVRWLWPGAGLGVVGLAGTLAGVLVVSAALRSAALPAAMDWPERATAFSELSADWIEE